MSCRKRVNESIERKSKNNNRAYIVYSIIVNIEELKIRCIWNVNIQNLYLLIANLCLQENDII